VHPGEFPTGYLISGTARRARVKGKLFFAGTENRFAQFPHSGYFGQILKKCSECKTPLCFDEKK